MQSDHLTMTQSDSCMLCGGGFFHASCGGKQNTRSGCKHRSELCGVYVDGCCSLSDPWYPPVDEGRCASFPCCIVGRRSPSSCRASSATNIFCLWEACSIPLSDEYLSEPVWGLLGVQCAPQQGVGVPPPAAQVIERPHVVTTSPTRARPSPRRV